MIFFPEKSGKSKFFAMPKLSEKNIKIIKTCNLYLCFLVLKNVKIGKGTLTVAGLIKLVQRFEETGLLEERVRSGRPSLRQTRSARVAAEMDTLVSESAAGTSSAWEAGRRLGLPHP
ncbi:hypothetical protein NPIL_443181 [Nephila pilipes]|uniref:DUF4817 domain-containing protein n=1 Tax=Nephila pilipes TaxID=299642 RepID=A0A8X6NNW9_NEPPI|nr:hypothetical protein NPIL_443181 [Nephila pilipes]